MSVPNTGMHLTRLPVITIWGSKIMSKETAIHDGAHDTAGQLADSRNGDVLMRENAPGDDGINYGSDNSHAEASSHGQEGARMIYAARPVLPGLQGLHELIYKQRSTVEATFFRAAGTNELHARRRLGRLLGAKAMGTRF